MKSFYFKDESMCDVLRDEFGNEEVDDKGKSIKADYKKISFKVPKDKCSINFDEYAQYTTFHILSNEEITEISLGENPTEKRKILLKAIIESKEDELSRYREQLMEVEKEKE